MVTNAFIGSFPNSYYCINENDEEDKKQNGTKTNASQVKKSSLKIIKFHSKLENQIKVLKKKKNVKDMIENMKNF